MLFCGLVYVCDYLSVRFQIPPGRAQYGSVQVNRSYAVATKDGKTQYMFDQPQSQTCVHSMFPHFGLTPCWYLQRHANQTLIVK